MPATSNLKLGVVVNTKGFKNLKDDTKRSAQEIERLHQDFRGLSEATISLTRDFLALRAEITKLQEVPKVINTIQVTTEKVRRGFIGLAGTTAASRRQFERWRQSLNKSTETTEKATSRVEKFRERLKNLGGEMKRMRSSSSALSRVMGLLFSGYLIRQTIQIADSIQLVRNRLSLVSSSASENIATFNELFDIAQRTGSQFQATSIVYSRLATAAKNLGVTQAQLLRVTETLNKAAILGGATPQETRAGLIQFTQGIASENLQGDELRSVLENLLGVSDALIFGLRKLGGEFENITKGQLREFAREGKLVPLTLLQAVLLSGAHVDELFAKTVDTAGKAFQQLKNEYSLLVDEFGRGGFTEGLIVSIKDLQKTVADPEFKANAKAFGESVGSTLKFIVENKDVLIAVAGAYFGGRFGPYGAIAGGIAGYAIGQTDPQDIRRARISALADESLHQQIEATQQRVTKLVGDRLVDQSLYLDQLNEELRLRAVRPYLNDTASTDQVGDIRTPEPQAQSSASGYKPTFTSQDLQNQIKRAQAAYDEALRTSTKFFDGAALGARRIARELEPVNELIANGVVDGFRSAEDALVDFVRTGKLQFSDLAESILADLARIAIRQSITFPIASYFGNLFGGVNQNTLNRTILQDHYRRGFPSISHSGGVVGGLAETRREVPQSVFWGAPRLHYGGQVLRSDEVPTILQTGERVLSRDEVARGETRRVYVSIENRASTPVQVTEATAETNEGGAIVAKIIIDDLNRNGQIGQAFGRAFGQLRRDF